MSKIFTVFGATGNQGGSVIKAVLGHPQLSKSIKIRAVTRDVNKASSVALKEKGAEVVAADMNDKKSIFEAIKGSSYVFGVTNYWEKMDPDAETEQGKTLADACKEAGVERFFFSSLPYVTKHTNGKLKQVEHFDSKARAEEYTREIGVPSTFFMPAVFMSGMFGNFKKQDSGDYVFATPLEPTKTQVPMIDIQKDTGNFIAAALLQLPETLNTRIAGAGGYITPDEMVEVFKSVTGKNATLAHISYDKFASFMSNPKVAGELSENMKLIEDPGYYVGEPKGAVESAIELTAKAGLAKPNTWKEFLEENFKE